MISSAQIGTLEGATVRGSDHDKIGKVVDVYTSETTNEPTFVTVKTGMFGGAASFVPLRDATLDGSDVVVPYGKDLVKDAPRLETDEELTPTEESRLYSHYGLSVGQSATTGTTGTTATSDAGFASAGHDTSGPNTDDAMTVSEEKLAVGTAQQEAGRARLRKYVTTETETRTVPVSHEEVVVQREAITDSNIGDALDGPSISEEEHEVVLTEEVPVVGKDTVPVERVRLGTETVTEQATVTEDVRKEHVEVDGDVNRTNR